MRVRFSESLTGVAVVSLAFLGAVGLGAWWAHQNPGLSTILVLAIALVIAVPLGVRVVQGRFDAFEPTVVFALAYGTMFVARPAVMIADHDYSLLLEPSINLQPAFNRMLTLALLGAICFVVGYALPFGRRWAELAPRPPDTFNRGAATTVALVLAGIGVLSFLLFVAEGGIGSLGLALGGRSWELTALTSEATPKYLSYGSLLLVGSAVLLFSLYRQRRTGAMLALTVAVSALVLLIHGSSGGRYALLPLLGGMLVFWFVSRGTRPRLFTSAVLVGVALFVSAGLVYGRSAQGSATDPTGGADYAAGFAKAASSPGAPLQPIEGEDAAMAPWLTAAMTAIPQQVDYGYGRYVATDLFTRLIPRQLWSGKPQPTQTQITQQIASRQGSVQVQPTYSVLMHAYLDFGMFGALWLLGFGVILRALFEWFLMHSRSVPAMLIFSLGVVVTVPALRDNPVDTLLLIGVLFLPIALAYRLTQRHIGGQAIE